MRSRQTEFRSRFINRYKPVWIPTHWSIEENPDVFLRPVDDLESLNLTVSYENQAIQILSSVPKQFNSLVRNLKYGTGNETLTLKEVTISAYNKEVELKD